MIATTFSIKTFVLALDPTAKRNVPAADADFGTVVTNVAALNCLINIIKGNYPDTYKAELRSWGFQKVKY